MTLTPCGEPIKGPCYVMLILCLFLATQVTKVSWWFSLREPRLYKLCNLLCILCECINECLNITFESIFFKSMAYEKIRSIYTNPGHLGFFCLSVFIYSDNKPLVLVQLFICTRMHTIRQNVTC